jgi:HEAT repeat protein
LHLAQAVLLVVPLAAFANQCLRDSGAPALRRARQLAKRLADRKDWPADLQAVRSLPEVKALREALHIDAEPALALLNHAKPPVRVAALTALEFRQNWRPGQPEMVLHVARRALEPEVRAAAVNALANLDDRFLIEALAEFLSDPSPLVRSAATEALLWNTEQHWEWIRQALRTALANPLYECDGPLNLGGNRLCDEAVTDLTAWATEKGVLAMRAALTLGAHYTLALASGSGPSAHLLGSLRRQLSDARTPAMLRLELARLLHQQRELGPDLLRTLLATSAPAPVRLIAVEALLGQQSHSPEAVAALHDLARLPNREIALSTADVLQRRLGVELGLPRGQSLPPTHSRLAAEVARRVLLWATQQDVETPSSS